MEYFCFEGDELWSMADDDLVEHGHAGDRAARPGQAPTTSSSGFVVRVPRPIRCTTPSTATGWPRSANGWPGSPNLIQVGRNGLHRYNNSDHSMLTAMRAVDNILDGAHHDIWAVNAKNVYHEEDVAEEHPYVDAPETPAMEQPLA